MRSLQCEIWYTDYTQWAALKLFRLGHHFGCACVLDSFPLVCRYRHDKYLCNTYSKQYFKTLQRSGNMRNGVLNASGTANFHLDISSVHSPEQILFTCPYCAARLVGLTTKICATPVITFEEAPLWTAIQKPEAEMARAVNSAFDALSNGPSKDWCLVCSVSWTAQKVKLYNKLHKFTSFANSCNDVRQ